MAYGEGALMILVAGGTGNVGAELVRVLASAGEPVRALSRNPDRVAALAGVEPAVADLNRPETVRPALSGVRGVARRRVPLSRPARSA